jgi:hypothetical protein
LLWGFFSFFFSFFSFLLFLSPVIAGCLCIIQCVFLVFENK